ncbi:hypothetical protein [Nitrosarchaeum sp.]|uniref:hypothetical protein n=1 Tax=Nitrosarchaeum sp. TaxID=2026886 RepID=UPI00247B6EAB|nr:hypothetical protein [Nitrosarchaeum sp.]MCV0413227.1 hypothetical protein [Nitrosarchaeum sp.]
MKTVTIMVLTSAIVLLGVISGVVILQNSYYSHEPIIGQNDLACFTVWRVQLNSDVDYKTLEKILRNKIAEFGFVYDIDQREITLENIGKNRVKITVEGTWWSDPDFKEPDLRKSILSIESVEKIEDFIGGSNEGGCH